MASTTPHLPKPPLDLESTSFDYLAQTISKIQQLPTHLIIEINDFIDFIVVKQDRRWQQWNHFSESLELSESDFSD